MNSLAWSSGNGCDFAANRPRFFEPFDPATAKNMPKVLREAQKHLRRFFTNTSLIPTLDNAPTYRDGKRHDRERDMRGERREACTALLGALVHRLDLVTLRVGRPGVRGEFDGISLQDLADMAGLRLRRAERASRDLVAAGIIKVHQIAELQDGGEYRGLAAIRTVSKSLFGLFGLADLLHKTRQRLYKRSLATVSPVEKARADLAMQSAQANVTDRKTAMEWWRNKHGPPPATT